MSFSEKSGSPRRRLWQPLAIVFLWAIAVAVFQFWPGWDHHRRVMGTMAASFIGGLVLALWWLGFSGVRWGLRLGLPLALILLAIASIRDVQFTGDLRPLITFRWEGTADDVLEAHRRRQGDAGDLPEVDLTIDSSTNFPEYRGRRRDGVVEGPPLRRDWEKHPPMPVWRQPVGGGYAAFAVAGNLAVTIEQRRDREAVVGYDTEQGRQRWIYDYPAQFVERLGGPGPRATPTIAGDEVYSLGATGRLVCLDARTGKLHWSTNILEGNDNIAWGMSGSPLVYDDVVVVNPGSQRDGTQGKAIVAYERATGKVKWTAGSGKAGYSSPMLATLAGKRQVLLLDGQGLSGYDADEGKELWRFPWPAYQDINVAQPVVLGGHRVFISTGYNVGCAMLYIKAADGKWTVEQLWRNKSMKCKFTSPVLYDRHLYGLDEGVLACVDAERGNLTWRSGNYGHGQLLLAGDLLLILAESGELALVQAMPAEHRQLGIIPALDESSGKTWNNPAIAHGKIFLRNHREMACYDLR